MAVLVIKWGLSWQRLEPPAPAVDRHQSAVEKGVLLCRILFDDEAHECGDLQPVKTFDVEDMESVGAPEPHRCLFAEYLFVLLNTSRTASVPFVLSLKKGAPS